MAWNNKYVVYFTSDDGIDHTLAIQEEDFAGSVTELNGGASPITIIQSESNMLDTVVGSGADIQLISAEPLQLFDLYAVEIMKYKVVLSNNGYIQWSGWLDSETYEEVYSEYKNYLVNFTATDGIALLDRLSYLDVGDIPFTDSETMFNIIINILDSVSDGKNLLIPTHIKFIVDGSIKSPPSNETFLHITTVNNENYYDELNEPLSCRDVLEGLLRPYGLMLRTNFLMLTSGVLDHDIGYTIADNNILDKESQTLYYVYNSSTGVYKYSSSLGGSGVYLRDLQNDLTYAGTGSNMTIDTPLNNQTVKYSPYPIIDVLSANLNEEDFCPYQTCSNHEYTTLHVDGTDENNWWSELFYTTNPNFTLPPLSDTKFAATAKGTTTSGSYPLEDNTEFFVRSPFVFEDTATDDWFQTDVDTQRIWGFDGVNNDNFTEWGLLVDYELFLRDGANWVNTPSNRFNITHKIRVIMGGDSVIVDAKYWGAPDDYPQTNKWMHPYSSNLIGEQLDENRIQGVFIKLATSQLGSMIDGGVTIGMTRYTNDSSAHLFEHRFKNFSVKIVRDLNPNGSSIKFEDFTPIDTVTEGVINVNAKNKADDINLIHGTRGMVNGLEKGVIMYKHSTGVYAALHEIDKGLVDDLSQPLYFNFEDWLINKSTSNFDTPRVVLSNITISSEGIKNSTITSITDVDQFPDKVFMIQGTEYDVNNSKITFSLGEVKKDRKDIINI